PTVQNREIVMTAKFTAVTFRQEDRPVAPDKSGQAPAGGARPAAPPPRPTAPTTAPPPPPRATTPAGAKARGRGAVEKGDARNRNAAGVDDKKGSDRLKGGL